MITPEILAIVMFLTTLGLLLFGFPVAFTLAGSALLFGFLGDALEVDLGSTTILSGDSNSVFLLQLRSGVAKEITDRTSLYGEINWNRSGGWTAGSGATEIKWQGLNMFGYGMGFRYKL